MVLLITIIYDKNNIVIPVMITVSCNSGIRHGI